MREWRYCVTAGEMSHGGLADGNDGSTETGAAGNLYAVGGPAKAKNLGSFVQSLTIYSQTAATRGVDAYFYYAEGTLHSVINAATKVLGPNFVKPIP
jgi:filamentous hemagglutinin